MSGEETRVSRIPTAAEIAVLEKTLSNPVRRRFMRFLLLRWESRRTTTPSGFAREYDLEVEEVSYHVRVCHEADAITLVTTDRVRGATRHFYRPSDRLLSVEWLVVMLKGGADGEAPRV